MKEVLDNKVIPQNYTLFVKINENNFIGEVGALIEVKDYTRTFNLNCLGLKLHNPHIIDNDKVFKCENSEEKDGFVMITCEKTLKKRDTVLFKVEFEGKYSDDMWGFYKSTYNDDDLYSTDFEPTNARRAFPCWDQPNMKATYDISIEPLPGNIALSNSSLKEIKNNVYHFNRTPKMSTYIVAYISGKLECVSDITKRHIPINVYAHKDEKDWGNFALKVAVECLDFFEEYFGINYPLPKLDLVSIPTFVSGAMENWGLVTFRKTSLLWKENDSSIRSKKLIAETVCHELAHMWLGNLVTMEWWNDLWLNEGFATWAASLALSHISKDLINWDVWTEFINMEIDCGMSQDCLEASHPIAVNVNKPSEINQIFDGISYSKGASMIKMLEGYIGEDVFKEGIRKYLSKFKYSNATTDDLWKSFPSELNVFTIMNDWINKQGFPLIEIKEDDENLILSQSLFLLSSKNSNVKWKIPVKICWLGEDIISETIVMEDSTITIQKKSPIYKLNHGAHGFYRVLYSTQNLAHLFEKNLGVEDRLNIINDVFALCKARRMEAIDVISLCELFREEKNSEILSSVLSGLQYIRSIFYDSEKVVKHINEIIMDVVGERINSIELSNCGLDVETLCSNSICLSSALLCDDVRTIEICKKGFDKYISKEDICPEYLKSVFISAVDTDDEKISSLAHESTIPEEKILAVSALAYIKEKQKFLRYLKDYKSLEPHNSLYYFINLGLNLSKREHVLDFICDDFDNIRKFMKNDRLFSYVIERVLALACTKEMSREVMSVLNKKRDVDINTFVEKAIETINLRMLFREYNKSLLLK